MTITCSNIDNNSVLGDDNIIQTGMMINMANEELLLLNIGDRR